MREPSQIDFYHGWMIELAEAEGGFYTICRSPYGKHFFNRQEIHPSSFRAFAAARAFINQSVACHAMLDFLREAYAVGWVDVDEWKSLSQSVKQMLLA
jgi:putative hemolysin